MPCVYSHLMRLVMQLYCTYRSGVAPSEAVSTVSLRCQRFRFLLLVEVEARGDQANLDCLLNKREHSYSKSDMYNEVRRIENSLRGYYTLLIYQVYRFYRAI